MHRLLQEPFAHEKSKVKFWRIQALGTPINSCLDFRYGSIKTTRSALSLTLLKVEVIVLWQVGRHELQTEHSVKFADFDCELSKVVI